MLLVAASANLAFKASKVVVCGVVLGMSIKLVTPPAAAAVLSVCMSAL